RVDLAAEALQKHAAEEALLDESAVEILLVERAPFHPAEDTDDLEQHEEVERPDHEEECARHRGPDCRAVLLEGRDLRVHRLRGDRETGGEAENDGGVAEGEEEAGPERTLAVLQELAR